MADTHIERKEVQEKKKMCLYIRPDTINSSQRNVIKHYIRHKKLKGRGTEQSLM